MDNEEWVINAIDKGEEIEKKYWESIIINKDEKN